MNILHVVSASVLLVHGGMGAGLTGHRPPAAVEVLLLGPPGVPAPRRGVNLPPALSISGRVLDADTGEPVPGIEVECGDRFEIGWKGPGILTDAEGAFHAMGFPPGRRQIVVGSGTAGRTDYAPIVLEGVEAGTEDLEIRLRRGRTISGRILDSSGEPVRNQPVTAELERQLDETPAGEPSSLTRRGTTGPDGSFVVKGLLAGKYRVEVHDHSSNDGPDPVLPIVRIHVDAGSDGLELVQHRGFWNRILIVDGDGLPVPVDGAHPEEDRRYVVWTRRTRAPMPGDLDYPGAPAPGELPDSSWRGWWPATLYDGTLHHGPCVPGIEYEFFVRDFEEGRWGLARAVAAREEEVHVALRAGLEIEGELVDQDRQPVRAGVPVRARVEGDLFPGAAGGLTETEEGGKFRIRGLADGAYRVRAGGGSSEFLITSGDEPALPGGKPVRLVVKRGVEISGRIVDRSARLDRAFAVVVYLEGGRAEAPVAEDGSFLLRGVPPGEIELQVWMAGKDERGVPVTYTIDCLPATAPAKALELDITEKRGD